MTDDDRAATAYPATDSSGSADARGPGDPLIRASDVTVAYGDVTVLSGVSLSVRAGEFVGLVGPNGAGKTTLLGAINGVRPPASGRVRVGGEAVADLSARETSRRVATVPQDTAVAFDFTVEDVVEMGRTPYHGRVTGDPDAEAAVERALERTETAAFRDRIVGSLSGGERQRVVLARALAQETPALLLDEPTASLDINHQVRTLELVRGLVDDEGKAALAAIHDLDLAARFCDRIAVVADGDLLAVGPPEDVLTNEHLATAFDAEAAVLTDPVTGTPTVTPLPATAECDLSVHVVGSGDAAARTVATLSAAGASVTAGVLPTGDVATAVARELGVETVTAPPFAPVDAETEAAARDALDDADVAVLAGSAPSSVRALVRDCDALVAVEPDAAVDSAATESAGEPSRDRGEPSGDRIDASARTAPSSVVSAVRRAARRPVEADD